MHCRQSSHFPCTVVVPYEVNVPVMQGLLQWLLQGPSQELSETQLRRYLLDTCHWEVTFSQHERLQPAHGSAWLQLS